MLCLDRALARRSIVYGAAAGVAAALIVLGRDQVALLSLYFLAGVRRLAHPGDGQAARDRARQPAAAGGRRSVRPARLRRAAAADRPVRRRIEPPRDRLHRRRPRLAASGPAAHPGGARCVRRLGPHGGLLGPAQLRLERHRPVHRPERGPALHRRDPAAADRCWPACAGNCGRARSASSRSPPSSCCSTRSAGTRRCSRLFYTLVPGVSLYRRPADATFLIGALGAILAGYAAHRLFTEPKAEVPRQQALMVAGGIGGAFLLLVMLALWRDRLPLLPYPLGISALTFAAARPAALLGATAHRRAADAGGDPARRLHHRRPRLPQRPDAAPRPCRPPPTTCCEPTTRNATIAILKSKVVRRRQAPRPHRAGRPRLPLAERQPDAQPGEHARLQPAAPRLYSEATGAEDHVGLPDQRKFSPLFPSYRSKLADLLGLRFIATGAPIDTIDRKLKPGDLPLRGPHQRRLHLREPQRLRPRAVRHRRAGRRFRPPARRRPMAGRRPQDRRCCWRRPRPPAPRRRGPARSSIVSYRNTEVVLEADSPDGGWVVLNDVWHPWWFAEVDGRPAEILRANVLFRAVAVPPGRHKVRFTFRPLAGALAQLRSPVPRHAP